MSAAGWDKVLQESPAPTTAKSSFLDNAD